MSYQKIKIYTEDVGNVENLTAKYFPGFTSIHCAGWYRGKKEHSVIIEIVDTFKNNIAKIQALNNLLHDILLINEQKSILLEVNGKSHNFITKQDLLSKLQSLSRKLSK